MRVVQQCSVAITIATPPVFLDLKAHLAREQVPAPLVEWMLEVLTLPNFSLRPTPLVDIQLALADAPEPYQPTEPAESDVDNIVWDGIPTPVEQGDEIPLNQVGIAEAVAAQASEPEPVGYVISLTKRGRCRRLHFTKDCWMVPGHHFKQFEVWGTTLPAEADISCVCSHCMPLGRLAAELGQALEAGRPPLRAGRRGLPLP